MDVADPSPAEFGVCEEVIDAVDELIGRKLWLRAEEIRGPRVLNYTILAER